MWLPSRRVILASLGASGALALSGCTLTAVHGGGAGEPALTLRYAEPGSRLQQVFYRAISARAGTSRDADAPELSISISISESRVGLTSVPTPLTDYQIIATGSYRVTQGGEALASGRRTASGGYQRTDQIVANDAARAEAEERVVVALAETIWRALVSELSAR